MDVPPQVKLHRQAMVVLSLVTSALLCSVLGQIQDLARGPWQRPPDLSNQLGIRGEDAGKADDGIRWPALACPLMDPTRAQIRPTNQTNMPRKLSEKLHKRIHQPVMQMQGKVDDGVRWPPALRRTVLIIIRSGRPINQTSQGTGDSSQPQ